MKYSDYKKAIVDDVSSIIGQLQVQPVLFVGSGLSRRYFNAPNWAGLLERLGAQCPLIDKEYAYYAQSYTSQPQIASEFAKSYQEWAWKSGRNRFAKELFEPNVKPDMFLKSAAAEHFESITPSALSEIDPVFSLEIDALAGTKPHAVITTNYDKFLELIFPDYKVVVGQSALRGMPFTLGEIFKIHGCVSEPGEMVLTSQDYDEFSRKKKFIAARLLQLFNEHPMLICGYSASDQNVCAILADIDEALGLPGSLIENIYFVEYDPDAEKKANLPTEKLIQIESTRSVRVKLIVTSDLRWVFNAFKAPETLNPIPAKIMRAILARSYELVRTDIPRKSIKVDFDYLERKLERSEDFAELFGITTVSNPSALSAEYPYSATELGKLLGTETWHVAIKWIKKIADDTGFDIRSGDNSYHRKERVNKSSFSKYSPKALKLIQKVSTAGECKEEWVDKPTPEQGLFD